MKGEEKRKEVPADQKNLPKREKNESKRGGICLKGGTRGKVHPVSEGEAPGGPHLERRSHAEKKLGEGSVRKETERGSLNTLEEEGGHCGGILGNLRKESLIEGKNRARGKGHQSLSRVQS